MQERQKRILYLDILRIGAAFCVILLHVTAQQWEVPALWCWDRRILDAYKCCTAWAVNVFLMISGILFLDSGRPTDIRKLYTKNIFRILVSFFFWSGVYALEKWQTGAGLQDCVLTFLRGEYHMWYLITLVALYAVVPILRKIAESQKITEYFLLLAFVCVFLVPGVVSFLQESAVPGIEVLAQFLGYWQSTGNFSFPRSMCFYFLLGYYLHNRKLSKKQFSWLLVMGVAGYLGRLAVSEVYIYITGSDRFPFDFGLFNLFFSIAVFLLVKQISQYIRREQCIRIIHGLSDCTYGIYLVHVLVLNQFLTRFDFLVLPPIWAAPLLAVLIFLVALGITWMIRQIPVLGKWLV